MKKLLLLTVAFGFLTACSSTKQAVSTSESSTEKNSTYWQQHVDYKMDIDMDVNNYQYQGKQNVNILPELAVGESLRNIKMAATQKFSSPPFRFTEGTLVKKLEELGIGRPSTYAPTITTIQNRKYVSKGNFEGEKRMYTELHLTSNNIETIKSKEMSPFPRCSV